MCHLGATDYSAHVRMDSSLPLVCSPQVAAAVMNVLEGGITSTAGTNLKRKFAEKNPYNSTVRKRRIRHPSPSLRGKLLPVGEIIGGDCFKRRISQGEDEATTCCMGGCNVVFSGTVIESLRAQVPPLGIGQQESRKLFVRRCLTTAGGLRLLGSSGTGIVCTAFFSAVTGCSRGLIASAKQLGGAGMRVFDNV